jgi:hypothetical protein
MFKLINFFKNLFQSNKIKNEIVIEQPEVKPATIKKSGAIKPYSKNTKVFNHLVEIGSIDKYIAKQLYGVTRLPSIINRLRNKGYNITSVPYIKNSVTYIYTK